ncbi:alpha/beta hydrolase-fold protein [Rhizobium sp. NXC24]|uniref:alpha/beta hydrolase-fold protein n=1 Tax=Rhizobium sp. NXC24 TaxID=2048897 RepID=UPI00131A59C5|nr:alpha/beta hydrolase-fold protein [Rhizobium sp. NXC24]
MPDPVSRRRYEIYVSLPADYSESSGKTYPLVIIADGGRAFPTLSCDARALANSNAIDQAVIVGLSYALGENLEDSRRRDYTPVALPSSGKLYGGAAAYQRYLGDVVLPYLQHKFEERLRSRGYSGLRISSTVIPGKDHIGSARPGFAWAIKNALGN